MLKTSRNFRSRCRLAFPVAGLVLLALPPSAVAQLVADGNLRVLQSDVGGLTEAGDHFGYALAAGDFDNDGFLDLAVGVPDEDVVAIADAGAVYVTYGSATGPLGSVRSNVVLHQDITGVVDAAEANDRFGAVLAVGDFDDNGYDDLAVGIPGESFTGATGAGAVHVFYGGPAGIDPNIDEFWHQDRAGVPDVAETDDRFGSALATGDFNLDGYSDLAVGVPGEDDSAGDAGAVTVIYGGVGGLAGAGSQHLATVLQGFHDYFGFAVATGDFVGDDADDLAVGVPGFEASGNASNTGIVRYFAGVVGAGIDLPVSSFQPNTNAEADSQLGYSVAGGNFDNAGKSEALLGMPFRSDGVDERGQVYLHRVVDPALRLFRQGYFQTLETSEPFDHFGKVVASGDFNGDGYADPVVGVPDEDLSDGDPDPVVNAGIVHVIYGSATITDDLFNQVWSLESPGIAVGALDNDAFGGAVVAGDFNGDGIDDLAIGSPTALWDSQDEAGFVQVIFGSRSVVFADGFESGDSSRWSGTVVD